MTKDTDKKQPEILSTKPQVERKPTEVLGGVGGRPKDKPEIHEQGSHRGD